MDMLNIDQLRALPIVHVGALSTWRREQSGLARLERWPVRVEAPDFTAAEWLECWGPYPGPLLTVPPRARSGATHRLEIDGSACRVEVTSSVTGMVTWSRAARLVGVDGDALVLEMLGSDGEPARTACG